jgi:hypothetical protein
MRTSRQHRIDRAIARTLHNCGEFVLPQETLIDEVGLLIAAPRVTRSEVEESILHMESKQRILGVVGESATQWKLTAIGQAWWMENL